MSGKKGEIIWNVECTKAPFEWLAGGIDTFTDVMELSGVKALFFFCMAPLVRRQLLQKG